MRLNQILTSLAVATALTPPAAAEADRHQAAASPALFAAPTRVENLHALPLRTREARLSGEIATRVVPLYLQPQEAARPAKIRVTYKSAVSVMPETSRVTVSVNDTVIGVRNIRSSAVPERLTFDVPTGLLRPGFNAVRFAVHQNHRVDCSRDAGYELWTQIVPEQTGLLFSGSSAEIRDVRDLPAVRPSRSGEVRIRVRTAPGTDPASLGRIARAVQAAVVLGRYEKTVVEVDPAESNGPGLDIAVGTEAAIAPILGSRPLGTRSRMHVQHDLRTDRVLLLITGTTLEDVDAALQSLQTSAANGTKPVGSLAGLRSLSASHGMRVVGGETVQLSRLGFTTQRFAGRHYRQSGLLQMPADFYPGDYGRVTLKLDAAYASDLLPTSKINVRVNGAVVSTMPLQKWSGESLSKRPLHLPLSAFKPGVNAIEIEADTISARDAECSPATQLQQRERFLLAQTSEIEVPALARIATFPSLSGLMTGSLATASRSGAMQVFLPRPGPETVATSLSFLAKIAAVSGRVIPTEYRFEQPDETADHVLTIGALPDIPQSLLDAAGLDSDALYHAWGSVREPEPNFQVSAERIRVAAASDDWFLRPQSFATWKAEDRAEVPPAEAGDLYVAAEEMSGRLAPEFGDDGAAGPSRAGWETIYSFLPFDPGRLGLGRGLTHTTDVISHASRLVIAQGAGPGRLQARWNVLPEIASSTVLVAPTAELLQSSMTDLLDSGLWQQLAGGVAIFDRGDATLRSAVTDDQFFVPTHALTPGNLRLIVAGWLSRNVGVYIIALSVIITLLSAVTYRQVRSGGSA